MTEETKIILNELKQMNNRMDNMDKRFDSIDKRFDSIDKRFDSLDQRMDSMDQRMDSIQSDLSEVRMTLENVTNRNIKIIAEGHLELSRKLDEVLRNDTNREIDRIRLNLLEEDVRKIKKKLDMPA